LQRVERSSAKAEFAVVVILDDHGVVFCANASRAVRRWDDMTLPSGNWSMA